MVLVGWSWGAWLCCLLAAAHPEIAAKLVLVGSGPFDAAHAEATKRNRQARLTAEERAEMAGFSASLQDPERLRRTLDLLEKADAYAADGADPPDITFDRAIHEGVWRQAADMRRSGELLERVAEIRCPVLALHGDHDPHPAAGFEGPLAARLTAFRFVLIARCGHKPWAERFARDAFFAALEVGINEGLA